MVKFEFVYDICTIQSYLAIWGERWISAMVMLEKVRQRRVKWCERGGERKVISAIVLPKLLLSIFQPVTYWLTAHYRKEESSNCIAEIAIVHFSASDLLIDCPLPKRGKRKVLYYDNTIDEMGDRREKEKKFLFGNLNAENRREFFFFFFHIKFGKDT